MMWASLFEAQLLNDVEIDEIDFLFSFFFSVTVQQNTRTR